MKEYTTTKKSVVFMDNGTKLTSVVYTDPVFSKKMIDYFSPQFKPDDSFLDPCCGHRSIYNNLPENKDWCEIQEGRDFLDYNKPVNWVIANFPWRGTVYTSLNRHAFEIADNVVSLVRLSAAFGTYKRFTDAEKNNQHIKEIIFVDWEDANFHYGDGSQKMPEGFSLVIIHWQRNYIGGTMWSTWKKNK